MKYLLIVFLFLCATSLSAQDVIVKKDGSTILSKVVEITDTQVKYKKHTNPKGPTYNINKSDVQCINYSNGTRDDFQEPKVDTVAPTTPTTPVVPQVEQRQLTDVELEALDRELQKKPEKPKKPKKPYDPYSLKWLVRGGYSLTIWSPKPESVNTTSCFEMSLGVSKRLGKSQWLWGSELGVVTYGGECEGKGNSKLSLSIVLSPRIGINIPLNKSMSIVPYAGLYGGVGLSKFEDEGYYLYDISLDDGETHGVYGVWCGVDVFFGKNFLFDIHCRKELNDKGVYVRHDDSGKRYPLNLTLGIGYQF